MNSNSKKNFVMFFGMEITPKNNPMEFGKKTKAHYEVLRRFSDSGKYNVWISRGYNNYLGENHYFCQWLYQDGKLIHKDDVIHADAILDRSNSQQVLHPDASTQNILNPFNFKCFAKNKLQFTKTFGNESPKTQVLTKSVKIEDALQRIRSDRVVVKPNDGMKGELIQFFNKDQAQQIEEYRSSNPNTLFIMQEFLDTSSGVPGLVDGHHDIRVVFIKKKIVWAHVRTPAEGSLLSNVAQGGKLTETDESQLPSELVVFVKNIANKIYHMLGTCFYSLDIGYSNGKYFVFEVNDSIGYPAETSDVIPSLTQKVFNALDQ